MSSIIKASVTNASYGYGEGSDYAINKGLIKRYSELILNPSFKQGSSHWDTDGDFIISDNEVSFDSSSTSNFYQYNTKQVSGNTYNIIIDAYDVTGTVVLSTGSYEGDTAKRQIKNGIQTYTLVAKSDDFRLTAISGATIKIRSISLKNIEPELIPNDNESVPISFIEDSDVIIPSSKFINNSDFILRLFEIGQTDFEYSIFDRSNVLIWKDAARLGFYNASKPGDWHISELNIDFIDANIQDDYRWQFISKIKNNDIKDLFVYDSPLIGDDIDKIINYTK